MMQPVEHAQFAALKEELNFSGHIVRVCFGESTFFIVMFVVIPATSLIDLCSVAQ
jgi:hypothetical protein